MSGTTLACSNWEEFEGKLKGYFDLSAFVRDRYIFRGQADATWRLESTLDRLSTSFSSSNRDAVDKLLLGEFEKQAVGLHGFDATAPSKKTLLLARHFGLPSRIMDWTRSPYVAAFFAFIDAAIETAHPPARAAIWMLNLDMAADSFGDDVLVIDDHTAIGTNPRAIEQRSVFLELKSQQDLAKLPGTCLWSFTLPTTERATILSRLEAMGINERSLFRSLETAATFAARRVRSTIQK